MSTMVQFRTSPGYGGDVLATLDPEELYRWQLVTRARGNTTWDTGLSLDPRPDEIAGGGEMGEPTDWAEAAGRRVRELARLSANWDGRDGLPPSDGVVDTVQLLLQHLQDTVVGLPMASVYPVPDGSLQFEWSLGSRHVEFRVTSPSSILCLHEEEQGDEVEIEVDELGPDSDGIATIRGWLLWLAVE